MKRSSVTKMKIRLSFCITEEGDQAKVKIGQRCKYWNTGCMGITFRMSVMQEEDWGWKKVYVDNSGFAFVLEIGKLESIYRHH